ATGKNLSLLVRSERISHHHIIFIAAEDKPQSRIISSSPPLLIIVVDVKLELTDAVMSELSDDEVNQQITFENCVIENQVNVEMVSIERDALLPRDKGKTLAQF